PGHLDGLDDLHLAAGGLALDALLRPEPEDDALALADPHAVAFEDGVDRNVELSVALARDLTGKALRHLRCHSAARGDPVERICEPHELLDRGRLCSCLDVFGFRGRHRRPLLSLCHYWKRAASMV